MRDYTGNAKITCSSSYDDCSTPTTPVCYTEYDCHVDLKLPLYICEENEYGPMGLACFGPDPLFFICTVCGQAPGGGEPYLTEQSTCPSEEWP